MTSPLSDLDDEIEESLVALDLDNLSQYNRNCKLRKYSEQCDRQRIKTIEFKPPKEGQFTPRKRISRSNSVQTISCTNREG